jgi:hypothetical protein
LKRHQTARRNIVALGFLAARQRAWQIGQSSGVFRGEPLPFETEPGWFERDHILKNLSLSCGSNIYGHDSRVETVRDPDVRLQRQFAKD